MKGINRVTLMGNIGKDPDIRSITDDMIVANMVIATTDRQKDQAGKWQDKTEWHNLVAFGRTAEIIRDYVKKGSHLHVEGKLQTRSWEDKDTGQKKYRTEVFVNDLILLGIPAGSREAANGKTSAELIDRKPRRGHNPAEDEYARAKPDYPIVEISDDDIPF